MNRNPYQVGLVVVGSLSLLTAAVLHAGLSNTSEYQPYDFTGVIGLTSWIAVLLGGAMLSFVGALVIAGVSWSARHSINSGSATNNHQENRAPTGP